MAAPNLGAFVSWLMIVYALSYTPFISESFVPASVRIGIEGFTICLLLILTFQYPFTKWIILLPVVFMIFGSIVISGADTVLKVVSSLNKIIFFILAIGLLCRSRKILKTCINIWIKLWVFLGVMAILSSLGYATGLIHFSPLEFSEITPGLYYFYLSNSIFGNLNPRTILDIQVGRVAGYAYEPGQLAFFFGFNILIARSWVNEKQLKFFTWVNFMAGLATFSMTFLSFFVFFFLVNFSFVDNKSRYIMAPPLFLCFAWFLYYIIDVGALGFTSAEDRFIRLVLAGDIIKDNTWFTTLFGNGIGVAVKRGEMGLSSAPVNILVERGAIVLVFMYYLLVRCSKHNRWLLLYLFYYSLLFEMFWWPVYMLAIAMAYAVYNGCLPARVKVAMKGMPAFQHRCGQRIILSTD